MSHNVYPLSVSNPQSGHLVFHSLLDKRYLVEVVRIVEVPESLLSTTPDHSRLADFLGYCGELFIFENHEPYKLLHRHVVHLSYAAQFGPDVDDVSTWQDLSVALIDGTLDRFYVDYPEMKGLTAANIIESKLKMLQAFGKSK